LPLESDTHLCILETYRNSLFFKNLTSPSSTAKERPGNGKTDGGDPPQAANADAESVGGDRADASTGSTTLLASAGSNTAGMGDSFDFIYEGIGAFLRGSLSPHSTSHSPSEDSWYEEPIETPDTKSLGQVPAWKLMVIKLLTCPGTILKWGIQLFRYLTLKCVHMILARPEAIPGKGRMQL
jgi:hypothetical protein